jgi:uncharacterized membrane protein YoaK (UPF0700 family)
MPEPAVRAGTEPYRSPLLPSLLLTLTVATGLVDAVSYLALGHVFVANMTGNVVFLAFALAGAHGLSVSASLTATGAFLVGAGVGGRLSTRFGAHRGWHLSLATSISAALVGVTVIISAIDADLSTSSRYTVTVLLALAMGIQNATARKLGVPDVTTTVLTLTLTGLAADSRLAGGSNPRPGRRIGSVLTMFCGALVGAVLVLHTSHLWIALAAAGAVMASITVVTTRLSRNTGPERWSEPS